MKGIYVWEGKSTLRTLSRSSSNRRRISSFGSSVESFALDEADADADR